jgi:hypothetical protein
MSNLVLVSLVLNIVVLVPVCVALAFFAESKLVVDAWGPSSPSRGILLSVYLSMLVASVALLFADPSRSKPMVAALLAAQVTYKLTTPITAGTSNPVVLSNVLVSCVHIVALWSLLRKTDPKNSYEANKIK